MKQFLYACIAALVAFGVSASAGEAVGETQVIITIPVVGGSQNQLGVCLEPLSGATKFNDMFVGIRDSDSLTLENASTPLASDATPVLNQAFFYYSDVSTNLYAVGYAATNTTVTVTPGVLAMLASPQAKAWSLSDVKLGDSDTAALENNSFKLPTAKANWVYIYDASANAYVKYWYDSFNNGWRVYGQKVCLAEAPVVPAGQGVYVKLSTTYGTDPVTLTFPQ